jgi:vacuolar protein sorting-associated protein 33A
VVFDSAQGLASLQKLFGPFPQIVGKGDHAKVGEPWTGKAPY